MHIHVHSHIDIIIWRVIDLCTLQDWVCQITLCLQIRNLFFWHIFSVLSNNIFFEGEKVNDLTKHNALRKRKVSQYFLYDSFHVLRLYLQHSAILKNTMSISNER